MRNATEIQEQRQCQEAKEQYTSKRGVGGNRHSTTADAGVAQDCYVSLSPVNTE